ncbi:MAG: Hsp20/alpha crystallin family protein [Armatimonadetes bacterium]|nr:Hsp20/alpha crystallin family protein [Armatimonadota bacterium]
MSEDLDWIRRMGVEIRWADDTMRRIIGDTFFGDALWVPRVDIYETKDALVVKVCAAGVSPESIDISLSGDSRQLTISGVRGEDEDARREALRYYQLEIYTGPFERTIQLPADIRVDRDAVSAVVSNGIFCITLPKATAEAAGPRAVPISSE